jgi:hypothetical protein
MVEENGITKQGFDKRYELDEKVFIFSTFYEQIFGTKVFWKAFLNLLFEFALFVKRILAQRLLVKMW